MASVADVERSIAFYKSLGFEELNRHTPDGHAQATWACLRSGGARLMVALEEARPDTTVGRPVLFYIYAEDIATLHAELKERGVDVGEITYPFWSQHGEFAVTDPDGYCLVIAHI